MLDGRREGLRETLATLHGAGIATAGAGGDAARAPACLALPHGRRQLLWSVATPSSGVVDERAADRGRSGVAPLDEVSDSAAQRLADTVARQRRDGDDVVVSVHWGGNWVPQVPAAHHRFARRLVDLGGADVVHGRSSHHPLPVEVHAARAVLYGCGDLINDDEGIGAHGAWRTDTGCLWRLQLGDDARPASARRAGAAAPAPAAAPRRRAGHRRPARAAAGRRRRRLARRARRLDVDTAAPSRAVTITARAPRRRR